MNKPLDPRKHGLVKPEKIITKYVFENVKDSSDLVKMYEQWLLLKKQYEDFGFQIIENPSIQSYDRRFRFSVQKTNEYYELQLSVYNEKVEKYEQDLLEYEISLKKQKDSQKNLTEHESIDDKIQRLETRLATLKAVKNGEVKVSDFKKV